VDELRRWRWDGLRGRLWGDRGKVVGRRYAILRLELGWGRRDRIEVGRVGGLVVRRGVLSRRGHWAGVIGTLRVGENARGTVTASGEIPARDEPSNFRRRKIGDIAAGWGGGLIICGRWGCRRWGRTMRWGVERHRTLRKGLNWHARIVGVGARVWQIICLRRTHVDIVDESRVLRRGVGVDLGKRCRAQQLYDVSI
jgi:hypothetical protein